MRNATRREALMLAGSAAALMPAAALAAIPTGDDAALLKMGREYDAAGVELQKVDDAWAAARRTIPEALQESRPVVDKTMPHRPKGLMFIGERISLREIRNFNRHTEAFAGHGTPEYWKRKAEGRERVRWWLAYRRAYKAAQERAGLPALEERLETLCEWRSELREGIASAPAHTVAGVVVKLRVLIEEMDREYESDWQMPYLQTALDTLQRMEGRNV